MKRTIAVIFAALAATLSLAAANPSYPLRPHPGQVLYHFGDEQLCSHRAASLNPGCVSADGTIGNTVNSETYNSGAANQEIDAVLTGQCNNGYVSGSCPFTQVNVDQLLKGSEIVTLNRHDSSADYFHGQWDPNDNVIQVGSTHLWVIFGDCANLTTQCQLISVEATNNLNSSGHFAAACDEGAGHALGMENTPLSNDRCYWNLRN